MDEQDVVLVQQVEHEALVVRGHLGVGDADEQVERAARCLAVQPFDGLDPVQAVVHPLPDCGTMPLQPAGVVGQAREEAVLCWRGSAESAAEQPLDTIANKFQPSLRVMPSHVADPPAGCEVDLGGPVEYDDRYFFRA